MIESLFASMINREILFLVFYSYIFFTIESVKVFTNTSPSKYLTNKKRPTNRTNILFAEHLKQMHM